MVRMGTGVVVVHVHFLSCHFALLLFIVLYQPLWLS